MVDKEYKFRFVEKPTTTLEIVDWISKARKCDPLDTYEMLDQAINALEAVITLTSQWRERGEYDKSYSQHPLVPDSVRDSIYEQGADMVFRANLIDSFILDHVEWETR